jgi:hypothetical protein
MTDIGADNHLLGVMSKDVVGQGITLVLGNTNPAAKAFRFVRLFKEDFLPPVELEVSRDISDLASHNRERDQSLGVDKNIAEGNKK